MKLIIKAPKLGYTSILRHFKQLKYRATQDWFLVSFCDHFPKWSSFYCTYTQLSQSLLSYFCPSSCKKNFFDRGKQLFHWQRCSDIFAVPQVIQSSSTHGSDWVTITAKTKTSVSTVRTWIRRWSCLATCATCSMMRVSGVASPRTFLGQDIWFQASNSVLFGILPLKAQND